MMLGHCTLSAACQQREGETVFVQLLHARCVCEGRCGSGLPTQLELLLTLLTAVSRASGQPSTSWSMDCCWKGAAAQML